MNQTDKFEESKTQAFTTLKEFDARVRLNQRRIKSLNERLEANPLDVSAAQELELAKAAHKFVLTSRATFKAQSFADRHPPTGLKLEQAQVLEETRQRLGLTADESAAVLGTGVTVLGVDPGAEPPVIFEGAANHIGITRVNRKSTAAEPQAPLPRDRSREFIPSARVIRERSHAGAEHKPKYAADDSRRQGLGYRNVHRKGEAWRRIMSLAIKPVLPPMRDATCFLMRNSSRRILVNGQAW